MRVCDPVAVFVQLRVWEGSVFVPTLCLAATEEQGQALGGLCSLSGLLTTGRLVQDGAGAGRVDATAGSGTALRTGLMLRLPTAPAVGCCGVSAGQAHHRGA